MKESVHSDYNKLYNNYAKLEGSYSKLEDIITSQQQVISKLETTISTKQKEVADNLTLKIKENTVKIKAYIRENKRLSKENIELNDRLTKIELSQIGNNIIISSMQEQSWENYAITKERVHDTIVAAMGGEDRSTALQEARKIEITCCSRIGCYQLNKPQPISVTFQHKDDKQHLLESKRNLPSGVYINEEFPAHMKRNRDILRPILKLAKSLLEYQDKARMQGEKLVINGTYFSINDLARLLPELAAFKAVQKTDLESIVFHGELSLYSTCLRQLGEKQ